MLAALSTSYLSFVVLPMMTVTVAVVALSELSLWYKPLWRIEAIVDVDPGSDTIVQKYNIFALNND
jgi:hypothetical protein